MITESVQQLSKITQSLLKYIYNYSEKLGVSLKQEIDIYYPDFSMIFHHYYYYSLKF